MSMGGRSWIEAYDVAHLEAAASQWTASAELLEYHAEGIHAEALHPGGTRWEGAGADAATEQTWSDVVQARGAADAMCSAAGCAREGAGDLMWAKKEAQQTITDAEAAGFAVSEDLQVTDNADPLMRQTAARGAQQQALAADITAKARILAVMDRQVAGQITNAAAPLQGMSFGTSPTAPMTPPTSRGDDRATVKPVDYTTFKDSPADTNGDRTRNGVAAFHQIYGHDPITTNDWKMATALDPQTYDPRDKGTPAEVRVVKIRPVPGQGLVRVSQWIEQRDVSSLPPSRDLGNGRTADSHFDPSNSKVTTYIDYDHGLVVMRQNPSIEQTDSGGAGQVKVQAPNGAVTQTSDGAVRIQYSASNPFAPPIAQTPPGPLSSHAWTVNGDLVFTPGVNGVHVDGTRGDYPSMEVYQDLPDDTTRTVLIDPADSGRSWGPFANLPFHHDLGVGGKAFAPFDTGGWNPRFDVRVPLPSTGFGLPSSPPAVPPLPPTRAVPS